MLSIVPAGLTAVAPIVPAASVVVTLMQAAVEITHGMAVAVEGVRRLEDRFPAELSGRRVPANAG